MKAVALAAVLTLTGCSIKPVVRSGNDTIWLGASVFTKESGVKIVVERPGLRVTYECLDKSENGAEAIVGLLKLCVSALWPL